MTREEILAELKEKKVSLKLGENGELTDDQLSLILAGVNAATEKEKAEKTILELSEENAKLAAGTDTSAKLPTFKKGADTHELIIPNSTVMFNGTKHYVNATTLRDNKDLLAHCIKIKSGALRLKPKSE